jgi:hypothetical protein
VPAGRNEPSTLEARVRAVAPPVVAYARSLPRNHHRAEDIAQNCFAVTLLGELFAVFDLSHRDDRPGDPVRVEAVFRPMPVVRPSTVRDVHWDLDPDTKAIRKAVLRRTAPAPLGGRHVLTLTFVLVETAGLDPARNALIGHPDPVTNVLDSREPNRGPRAMFREELFKHFAERIGKP